MNESDRFVGVDARTQRKYMRNACEKCGSTENLDLHHVDKDRRNGRLSNLQTLCKSCHAKTHKRGQNFRAREKKLPDKEATCQWCGAHFTHRYGPSQTPRFCSRSCVAKWRHSIVGPKFWDPQTTN